MAGWGQSADRGVGSSGQIEAAHRALDQIGVPAGNLATRVAEAVARRRAGLMVSRALLERLLSEEECVLDHHGNCQAHMDFSGGRCRQAELRETLNG